MRDDWRLITVKQPWAGAIADSFKVVENRSRAHSWRGHLGIHAGVQLSGRGMADWRIRAIYKDLHVVALTPGAVVAVAELTDVHPDDGCCRPWGESEYHDAMKGATVRQVFHYVLEAIQIVVPALPVRGALGLWKPDVDLAAELDRIRR